MCLKVCNAHWRCSGGIALTMCIQCAVFEELAARYLRWTSEGGGAEGVATIDTYTPEAARLQEMAGKKTAEQKAEEAASQSWGGKPAAPSPTSSAESPSSKAGGDAKPKTPKKANDTGAFKLTEPSRRRTGGKKRRFCSLF